MTEWLARMLTYSFNVDFEALEGVLRASANALLVELNSLLLEEVLNGRLRNCTVIGGTVLLDPAPHVLQVVVSAFDLIFR